MNFIVLAAALIALPVAALAVEPASDSRFQMERQGDSIIRLDRRTGAISVCKADGASLDCRMSADERAALQEEIDRLAAENEQLRTAKADEVPGTGISKDGKEITLKLPSEQEIQGVMAYFEDMLRRFVAAMKELTGPA